MAIGGPNSYVVAEKDMRAHQAAAWVWKRFVDDVILIIKRAHLNVFHEDIISLHPKI